MPEIRCANKLHGEVSDNSIGIFIRRCDSRFCRSEYSINEVVEHRWNLEKITEDGIIKPVETTRFKRPEVRGITGK